MVKSDYSPPELPPLSEVLSSVRKSKPQNETDYKKEYEALKQKVEKLTQLLEEQQELKEERPVQELLQIKERTCNCPILQRKTGSGEITIISRQGINEVLCEYGFESNTLFRQLQGKEGDPYCKLSDKPCGYAT